MAEHLSAEDLKQRYIETMRAEMGEFFHHLFQETARLHLKWNEYEALFNAGPVKIANMNLAAPGFFWLAQNALWHDIILHVCRITDNGTKVLSVKRLPRMTQNVPLRDDLEALLQKLENATEPARAARDQYIAHLEYEVLRDERVEAIVPERDAVFSAITALDALIHFVDSHFTKAPPMMWEHLDMRGGAVALHDIVRRGLRDRDERMARYDLS
jgi:hypothetical protein